MMGHFVQTRLSKGLTECATEVQIRIACSGSLTSTWVQAAIGILNGTPHPNRLLQTAQESIQSEAEYGA